MHKHKKHKPNYKHISHMSRSLPVFERQLAPGKRDRLRVAVLRTSMT